MEPTTDTHLQMALAEQPYRLLFATLSGAHLYGFASPDSDFDVRGVHMLPLRGLLRLDVGRETIERTSLRDGLEIDLVTHEVRKFFLLMLKKGSCEKRTYRPRPRLAENRTVPLCSPWQVPAQCMEPHQRASLSASSGDRDATRGHESPPLFCLAASV
jgi:hypothetical protein